MKSYYNEVKSDINILKRDSKNKIVRLTKNIELLHDAKILNQNDKQNVEQIDNVVNTLSLLQDVPYLNVDSSKLVKDILNNKFTKKSVFINAIGVLSDTLYNDDSKKVYHYLPLKLDIYCDNSFDTTKMYNIKELVKLANQRKLLLTKDITFDKQYFIRDLDKTKISNIYNTNRNITLGNIKYLKENKFNIIDFTQDVKFLTPTFEIKTTTSMFDKLLKNNNINENVVLTANTITDYFTNTQKAFDYVVSYPKNRNVKNSKQIKEDVFKLCVFYPESLNKIQNFVEDSVAKNIQQNTNEIKTIKETYSKVSSKIIENAKLKINKEQESINILDKNYLKDNDFII